MAQPLIAKVRAAAGARLKTSLRLRERVRHRIGEGARDLPRRSAGRLATKGEGLVLIGTSTGGPPALEALLTGTSGIVPLAHRHCATHASHVHRPVGTAPRRN